jgi:hypothetical protein
MRRIHLGTGPPVREHARTLLNFCLRGLQVPTVRRASGSRVMERRGERQ